MRAMVYYDASGDIQSVVQVDPKAGIMPRSAQHSSFEIDLRDTEAETLVEIHSNFRVDTAHRTLIRRPEKE